MRVAAFTEDTKEDEYDEDGVLSNRSTSSTLEDDSKRRKGIPIWLLLLLTSLLVVVTVSISITLISYFNGQYTIDELSGEVRDGYMQYIVTEVLDSMENPIIAQGAMQGFFDPDQIQHGGSLQNRTDYLKFLNALTAQFPAVTFIGFATPGYIMTLYKMNGIDKPPNVVVNDVTTAGSSNFYDINFTSNSLIQPALFGFPYSLYDDISWIVMNETRATLWSDLQVAPNGELSCGLQSPMFTSSGNFIGYTLASYSLDILSQFFQTIKPTKNACAFIIDGEGYLIATNQNGSVSYFNNATGVQTQYLGTEAEEALHNKIIPETTNYFLNLNNYDSGEYKGSFEGKAGTILVDIYAFKDLPGFDLPDHPLDWYLVLAIPKDDFVGRIEANFKTSIILTAVFSVIGVIMSVVISVFITQPLTTLKNNMNSVATLDIMAEKQAGITSKHSPRFLLPLQEIQSMKTSFERMRNGIVSFGKFVPVDYVKYLLQSNKEAHRSLVFTQVTVLFMDIVGFTSMSEKMAPKNLQNVLGKFFDEMSTIILQNEGTIDKYIGDCIMAVWNAPRLVENHTNKACWAAIKCIEQLDRTRAKFEQLGAPNFRVRIGIHTGPALVGNVGSKQRLNFTVLGDTVNVASRLEGLNKKLKLQGIIVSSDVQKAVTQDKNLIMEDQGEHLIDGRQAPIHVYCLKPQESLDRKQGTYTRGPATNTAVMDF